MERDLVRVRESYTGWKTEDLKRAITLDKAGYEPWAINIIKEELRLRNVNSEDLDSFHKNYIREEESLKNGGKLYCPKCHSLNIKRKTRWWRFALLLRIIGVFAFFFSSPMHQCDDCGYYFRRRTLKERGAVLGNLWEKVKAELD